MSFTINSELIHHMNIVISGDQNLIQQSSNFIEKMTLLPDTALQFLAILIESDSPNVRTLASILLRNAVINNYGALSGDVRRVLKENLLNLLLRDEMWIVKKGIAHLVIALASQVLKDATSEWNNLLPALYQLAQSGNDEHIRVGLFVLRYLSDLNGSELRDEFDNLKDIFQLFLVQHSDPKIRVMAILGEINIMQWLSVFTQIESHAETIPHMLNAISDFVKNEDEDETIEALNALTDLAESPIPIINPHINSVLSLAVEIASTLSVSDNIRLEALSLISWMIKHKHKHIGKGEKFHTLLHTGMINAAQPEDNPYDDDENSLHKAGIYVVDDLAKYISAELAYQCCTKYFQEYMSSNIPENHKAVLGVILKLCTSWVDNLLDDLDLVVQYVIFGMNSQHHIVRKAACMAIGRLSDNLQPYITEYHAQIIPLIYNLIGEDNIDIKEKALYALVSYVEYMEHRLEPYADGLMDKLINLINVPNVQIQEMVLSAISAVVVSSKGNIMKFINQIFEITNQLMNIRDFETLILKGRAIELVGNLALAVGKDNFKPFLDFYMKVILETIADQEQSLIHEDCFGFIGNAAEIMGAEFNSYLDTVVPIVLQGCSAVQNEEIGASAVIEERKQAIHTLSVLVMSLGEHFLPYLQDAMHIGLNLIEDSMHAVRKAAVNLTKCFIFVAHKAFPNPNGKPQTGVMGSEQPLSPECQTFIDALFPIYIVMIQEDESCDVVAAVCETVVLICAKLGTSALDNYIQQLIDSLTAIFLRKAVCNFPIPDSSDEEMEPEFYQIEEEELQVMIEGCAVISMLARLYEHLFYNFFQIVELLEMTFIKPEMFISYRYEASGCISEVIELVGAPLQKDIEYLFGIVQKFMNDPYKNIHNNGAYLAGVLCSNFPEDMKKHCKDILTMIQHLFDEKEEMKIRDNAASCVAKMMMAFPDVFPFTEVLPVFLDALPLVEDMDENYSVYGTLISLLERGQPELETYIPRLLNMFTRLIANESIQSDIQEELANTVGHLLVTYPSLQQTVSQLSDIQQHIIAQIMQ